MTDLSVALLLDIPSLSVRDVVCGGRCRHQSAEECPDATALVFPYRGVFMRHIGRQAVVADPGQLAFFNAGEGYRISHPVEGGDACLSLGISEDRLLELAPRGVVREGSAPVFHRNGRRIGPRTQALAALLRHRLVAGLTEPLEAESLALALVAEALGERVSPVAGVRHGRQKIADRARLVLADDPARRWTLAEVAARVGVSPVYLTQVFRQVEGVPLYRHQLRLRLARALELIPRYSDMTALALDLGFTSQSHFGAAFKQAYGCAPAQFRRAARCLRPVRLV